MKTTLFLISTLILFSYSVSAQKNHGFYGKTNFVEFTSVSYFPVLKNLFVENTTGYKKAGNSLVNSSPDWFNTGFRVSIGRAFRKNFGMSLEYGISFWSNPISPKGYFTDYQNSFDVVNILHHENLDMSTIYYMPKFHFTSKGALLPLGLNHEVGIGYTQSRVKKKEYLFTLAEGSEVPKSSSDYIDFDRVFRGIQLYYGLKMRKPLTKSILLNYGLRYTLDMGLRSKSPFGAVSGYFGSTSRTIEDHVKQHNLSNLLSFDLGLTYAF